MLYDNNTTQWILLTHIQNIKRRDHIHPYYITIEYGGAETIILITIIQCMQSFTIRYNPLTINGLTATAVNYSPIYCLCIYKLHHLTPV